MAILTGTANAQSTGDADPPPGPLLASAPDFSLWVATFSYADEKDKSAAPAAAGQGAVTRTRTITTTKTRDIVHEETVDSAGNAYNVWRVGATFYTKGANSTLWGQVDASDSAPGNNSARFDKGPPSGFRGLDWITRENYAGMIKASGHSYLVFTLVPGHKKFTADTPLSEVEALNSYALVDAESHLPVQMLMDGCTRTYQFKDPPTERLELPADLADQLKKGEEGRKRLNMRMPTPY